MVKTVVMGTGRTGSSTSYGGASQAATSFKAAWMPLGTTGDEPFVLIPVNRATVGADQPFYLEGRAGFTWDDFTWSRDKHEARVWVLRTAAGAFFLPQPVKQYTQDDERDPRPEGVDPLDIHQQRDEGEHDESNRNDLVLWLASQDELLRPYAGEWVALAGRTIVAHAKSFLEVMRQVNALGIHDPLLVPVAPERPFVG